MIIPIFTPSNKIKNKSEFIISVLILLLMGILIIVILNILYPIRLPNNDDYNIYIIPDTLYFDVQETVNNNIIGTVNFKVFEK